MAVPDCSNVDVGDPVALHLFGNNSSDIPQTGPSYSCLFDFLTKATIGPDLIRMGRHEQAQGMSITDGAALVGRLGSYRLPLTASLGAVYSISMGGLMHLWRVGAFTMEGETNLKISDFLIPLTNINMEATIFRCVRDKGCCMSPVHVGTCMFH